MNRNTKFAFKPMALALPIISAVLFSASLPTQAEEASTSTSIQILNLSGNSNQQDQTSEKTLLSKKAADNPELTPIPHVVPIALGEVVLPVTMLTPRQRLTQLNNQAMLLMQKGNSTASISELSTAIAQFPSAAILYANRGFIFMQSGKLSQSVPDLQKSLILDPNNALTTLNLGLTELKLGKFKESMTHLNGAIALKPELALAYNARGSLWHRLGEFAKAEADLNRALQLDPKNAETHNNLALLKFNQGDRPAATDEIKIAHAIDPASVVIQKNLEFIARHDVGTQCALKDNFGATYVKTSSSQKEIARKGSTHKA